LVRASQDAHLALCLSSMHHRSRHSASHVDAWGIDVIIGGSQKALMIPPGLAYGAIQRAAWQRWRPRSLRDIYFDLCKERKSAAKGGNAYTPATSLFAGLAAAFDYLRQMGDGNLAAGRECARRDAECARR